MTVETEAFDTIRESCHNAISILKMFVAEMPSSYETITKQDVVDLILRVWYVMESCHYA